MRHKQANGGGYYDDDDDDGFVWLGLMQGPFLYKYVTLVYMDMKMK